MVDRPLRIPPRTPPRTKLRVVLVFDPARFSWEVAKQAFCRTSWPAYYESHVDGREPEYNCAVGHVSTALLRNYNGLDRSRLSETSVWPFPERVGCPFPEHLLPTSTEEINEDEERWAQDPSHDRDLLPEEPEEQTRARKPIEVETFHETDEVLPSETLSTEEMRSLAPQPFEPEVVSQIDKSLPRWIAAVGEDRSGVGTTAAWTPKPGTRVQQPRSKTKQRCKTAGSVVCKLLRLEDCFGWDVVDWENATDPLPKDLGNLDLPVSQGTHFLLASAYREPHDSSRRRSLAYLWTHVPAHYHALMVVESTCAASHEMHVHVPNASILSGDWEPGLDGLDSHGGPRLLEAAKREIFEETGLLVHGCRSHIVDWSSLASESSREEPFYHECLVVVDISDLRPSSPLHLLHPRVIPKMYNDAPYVPELHIHRSHYAFVWSIFSRSQAIVTSEHGTSSMLRLCVIVHEDPQETCDMQVIVHEGEQPPLEPHVDVVFSSLRQRNQILKTIWIAKKYLYLRFHLCA